MIVLSISFSGLKESAALLEEKNALLLVTKLANSPEFSCGDSFGSGKTKCIDFDKVMVLKDNIENYENFWGVSGIKIKILYPPREVDAVCEKGNYPDCNEIYLLGEKVVEEHSTFVSLCRKDFVGGETQDKCEIARLMVSYGEE
jgi:hypothetical protein